MKSKYPKEYSNLKKMDIKFRRDAMLFLGFTLFVTREDLRGITHRVMRG